MSPTAIFALVGLLASGNAALADQFYFESAGNTVWNGVYVNSYAADDNSQPQNNPLTVFCDDWNTDFSGNPTWNASVYALTAANLSNFKFGDTVSNYDMSLNAGQLVPVLSTTPDAFDRYLEAAWLDSLTPANSDQQIEIAAAEWTLFVDSGHVDGLVSAINSSTGYAPAVYAYLQDAQSAVAAGYKAPGWDVIVPVDNATPMQEFLTPGFNGNLSTPEPGAVILLGTIAGLLWLGRGSRWKSRDDRS